MNEEIQTPDQNVSIDERAFIDGVLDLYSRDVKAEKQNRDAARHDLKYIAGNQWEQSDIVLRGDRPTFTFNRLIQSRNQIAGEIKQNEWAIKAVPVDDGGDKDLAKAIDAITRHIEYSSRAPKHYAAAGVDAASCGFGYVRLLLEYARDDSFEQDIKILPVNDPLSVVLDSLGQDSTGADCRHGFITTMMDVNVFKATYPGKAASNWKQDQFAGEVKRDWFTSNSVRVAEFFQIEEEKYKIVDAGDGRILSSIDYEDRADQFNVLFEAAPAQNKRMTSRKKIMHYKLTANSILEKTEWPGARIPIFRSDGDTVRLGDVAVRMSAIRHAKDAQRAFNIAASASIEEKGLTGKAPIIATTDMIDPAHQETWENLGASHVGLALFKNDPTRPGDRPGYLVPPPSTSNWAEELSFAAENIKATTGIYDASLGNRSNETSGVAINARASQGRNATYTFIDNLTAMIEEVGREMVLLIPKVYSPDRVLKIYGEDGGFEEAKSVLDFLQPSDEDIEKYQAQLQAYQTGQIPNAPEEPQAKSWEDVQAGKYDVVVSVGRSYSSRRQEAAQNMIDVLRALPVVGEVAADMMVREQDWPSADKVADRIKQSLIAAGRIEDPEKDKTPPPPNPAQVAQLRLLEAQAENAEYDAVIKSLQINGQAGGQLMQLVQQAVATALANKQDMINGNDKQPSASESGEPNEYPDDGGESGEPDQSGIAD